MRHHPGYWLVVTVWVLSLGCMRSGYKEEAPELSLTDELVRFSVRTGEVVLPQTITLADAHGRDWPWRSSADRRWVNINPSSGVGATEIQVSVVTRSLEPGNHRAEVVFTPLGDDPEARPAVLIVELEIQAPGWTALEGLFGGDILSVAVDPADSLRIFAGSDNGNLYRSEDGGQSFFKEPLGSAPVTSILLLPSGRGYLTTDEGSVGGLFRTDDAGNNWAPTSLQNVRLTSVAARDDQFLLAEGDGLWQSPDGGQSWTQVSLASDTRFVANDPADPATFVVGGNDGVVNIGDGVDFTEVATGREEAILGFAAALDGTWYLNPAIANIVHLILESTDRGSTWQTGDREGLPDNVYSRRFHIASDEEMLWGLHSRAYLSEDGGRTFFLVDRAFSGYGGSEQFHGAWAHPQGTLLAHDTEGILRHVPGEGLVQLPLMAHSVMYLDWSSDTRQLTGVFSPGGVFRRTGNGPLEGLGGTGMHCDRFSSVSVDPRNSMTIVAGSNSCSGIYRTEDGGRTWNASAPGLLNYLNVHRISRAPEDPDSLWIATGYPGMFRSADGGLSFEQVVTGGVTQVVALSSTTALFNRDGISRYDTSSGTFGIQIEMSVTPSLLRRTQDGSIWYGGSMPLNRSIDSGETFQEVAFSGPAPRCIAVDPGNPTRIYVGFEDGLFESRDNGATFQEAGAPFPVRSLVLDPDTGELYVGTDGGGLYHYLPL